MQTDTIEWKLQSSSSHGPNTHMTHTAEIDPWSLPTAQTMARELAPGGWTPVLPTDAEGTGVSGGYAVVQRATSITASERTERFWLVGSIAFLNAEMTVALYVELLSGKIEQRLALDDTLSGVRAHTFRPALAGRHCGAGAGQRTRIRELQAGMLGDYGGLVPKTGWLQVPFFAPNGTLRMSWLGKSRTCWPDLHRGSAVAARCGCKCAASAPADGGRSRRARCRSGRTACCTSAPTHLRCSSATAISI